MKEFGQTSLIIDIFTNDITTQSRLDYSLICAYIKSLWARKHDPDLDPAFLGFFEQVMVFNGELIESNVKKVVDNIFFTNNFFDFFGMLLPKGQG